jgi:DNA-binding CsgD family transcriptional regulator
MKRHGLINALSYASSEKSPRINQRLLVARSHASDRFTLAEVRQFEVLVPHMFQAYNTARGLHLNAYTKRGDKLVTRATALVDRTGAIHDENSRFVAMFQREWSGWTGTRVPDALSDLVARNVGSAWQFVGEQIVVDFSPIHEFFLIAARPRVAEDVLTERERKVAQQYAAGSSHKEIAKSMHVAPATVRAHVRNIFRKLKVTKKAHLADLMQWAFSLVLAGPHVAPMIGLVL